MDAKKIIEDIECKYSVQDFQVRNVNIWWFIRESIYNILQHKLGNTKRPKITGARAQGFKNIFLIKDAFFNKHRKVNRTEILCVTSSDRRRSKKEGKYFNIFFDYLEELKVDYINLETLTTWKFMDNLYNEKDIQDGVTNFLMNLGRRFYKFILYKNEIKRINTYFFEIETYISGKYSVEISLRKFALQNLSGVIFSRKHIEKIITQVSPKILFMDCAYSPSHMVYVFVARNLGIPVVEFQHGLISENHIGYIYNLKGSILPNTLPNKIVVYGDFFKRNILLNNNNIKNDIYILGYPHLEEEMVRFKSNGGKIILVTTQGNNQELWRNLIPSIADLFKDYKIIMRPHPNEKHSYPIIYSDLLAISNVRISDNESLYDDLKLAEFHLSVSSTSHLEAVVCGVKDIIIEGDTVEHISFLNIMGIPKASNMEDLEKLIRNYPEVEYKKIKKDLFNINTQHYKEKLSFLLAYLEDEYYIDLTYNYEND